MPQGRKGVCDGAKASQHFSMCFWCQVSHQIIAVPCMAPTFFARLHSCACCPLVLALWLPTASRGPHSRSPSHASALQHVTTCRACGSAALRRPEERGGGVAKGDKIRIGCLTPAFWRAHKWAEMLRHPCILDDPQQRGQNQNTKKKNENFPMMSIYDSA